MKRHVTTLYLLILVNIVQALSTSEILDKANQRIETHRKSTVIIRLIDPQGKPVGGDADVEINQTRHKFLFGCNIFMLNRSRSRKQDELYKKYFSELLNFATLPFYWWNYERTEGHPDYQRTITTAKWCSENNITTKGHPLAWNYIDPGWIPTDPQKAMQLQMGRIEECIKRFKGQIDIWDVVNEATHYDRKQCWDRAPVLTKAIDRMTVGKYLKTAFNSARKGNPDATLLINDYRTDQQYIDRVLNELVDKDNTRMYDVIGIQSHMHGGYWGPQRIWNVCEKYAQFKKPLHFTETTIVSGPKSDKGWNTTDDGEMTQARQVEELYTVLFSHPAVEAVTWWDFSDQGAWQGAPAGFLRKDMTPKPVYDVLKKLIRDKWWTRVSKKTDPDGKIMLSGFLGDYSVTVNYKKRKLAGTFTLEKTQDNQLRVELK